MSMTSHPPYGALLLLAVTAAVTGALAAANVGFVGSRPTTATAGGPTATDTPLPALTPLPVTPAADHLEGLPLETGTGALAHARSLAMAQDGTGRLVFTVGKTYPHQAALFVAREDSAPLFAPLPETVRGFRDLQAVPDGFIIGAAAWGDGGGNRFAYRDLFHVDHEGNELTRLTDGSLRINDFLASSDGQLVAMLLHDGRLLELEAQTGATRTLRSGLLSPAGIAAATMAFAPDGGSLVVGFHPSPERVSLERIMLPSADVAALASWPGAHQPVPVFLPDGRLRVLLHAEAATAGGFGYRTQLMAVDPGGGSPLLLADLTPSAGPGEVVRQVVPLPDEQGILYRQDGALWRVSPDGTGLTRLPDVMGHATAGPVLGSVGGALRVGWIERALVESGTGDQPIVGGPGALTHRVRWVSLP